MILEESQKRSSMSFRINYKFSTFVDINLTMIPGVYVCCISVMCAVSSGVDQVESKVVLVEVELCLESLVQEGFMGFSVR